MDETTEPVPDPGRGRTKPGDLWAIARDDRGWGRAEGNRIQNLERELARKEKALAEAAAPMILRKKAEAIRG